MTENVTTGGMTSSDGGLVQCSVVSRHQYYELLVVCIGVAHYNIAHIKLVKFCTSCETVLC